ncbi:MAG TPA: sialidase family protein [Kofleriaceae bacterium]|nr:sialidase family protein [Kofleriaceae bacterium]
MHRSLSLLLLTACGAAAHPTSAHELVALSHIEHLDAVARETAIVQHPNGHLFVAGYGPDAHPHLWQSGDLGASWTPVGLGDGAVGNSDVDLAVAPDGTLYFINLLFDRDTAKGKSIAIAASRDAGATWTWTTLSTQPFDDRPWVVVASDGSAHAIWSNEAGVHHAVSRDRGATWQEATLILNHGGSSHFVAGPHGLLAARITPTWGGGAKMTAGVDEIRLSADGGETWTTVQAPGERTWKPLEQDETFDSLRWVEPLAFDAAGNLYSAWTARDGVHIARSRDRGTTWSQNLVLTSNAFFPYAIATPTGLALTWFTAASPALDNLRWHIAAYDGVQVLEAPAQRLDCTRKNAQDTCGEYLMPAALADGHIGLAAPVQHEATGGFTFWTFEAR